MREVLLWAIPDRVRRHKKPPSRLRRLTTAAGGRRAHPDGGKGGLMNHSLPGSPSQGDFPPPAIRSTPQSRKTPPPNPLPYKGEGEKQRRVWLAPPLLLGEGVGGRGFDASKRSFQKPPRILVVNLSQHLVRQMQSAQNRCCRLVLPGRVVRVGDGAAAFPGALPQRPLTPVTADVMVARQAMPRHQVGAEQKAPGITADQRTDGCRARRRFADDPFGGARVQVQVRSEERR